MKKNILKQLLCLALAALIAVSLPAPAFAVFSGGWNFGTLIYEGTGMHHSVVPGNGNTTPDAVPDLPEGQNLPAKFNSMDEDLVNAPEAQAFGDCWAYSAVSVLEANAAKQGFGKQHFSKSHLCWFTLHPQREGMKSDDPWNYGGNHILAAFSLLNLEGIANQSDYPNKTADNVLTFNESDRYNRGSGFILEKAATLFDADDVKEWIYENGAAVISFYEDGHNVFNPELGAYMIYNGYLDNLFRTANHAITVIGWDDTIPASAFSVCGKTPSHNGAWIIKNSWHGDVSDIMYFSYDQPVGNFGGLILRKDDVFKNYTHAERGTSGYLYGSYAEQADVFTAENDERISRICFMADDFGRAGNVKATVKIYKNLPSGYTSPLDGSLAGTFTVTCPYDGIFSCDINENIGVSKGEIYAVTVSYEAQDGGNIALQLEQDFNDTKYVSGDRESYVRIEKDSAFIDTNKDISRFSNASGIHNTFVQVYTKCNHTVSESGGKRICSQCGKDLSVICETHGDGYWLTSVKPTVTSPGKKVFYCSECATPIKEETIPALDNAKLSIAKNPGTKTVDYSDILKLTANAENPPDGYHIEWYVDGKKAGSGTGLTVVCENTMDVSVKYIDENGNSLKDTKGNEITDSETVKVNRGFFRLIIGFFRFLFGTNKTKVQ